MQAPLLQAVLDQHKNLVTQVINILRGQHKVTLTTSTGDLRYTLSSITGSIPDTAPCIINTPDEEHRSHHTRIYWDAAGMKLLIPSTGVTIAPSRNHINIIFKGIFMSIHVYKK